MEKFPFSFTHHKRTQGVTFRIGFHFFDWNCCNFERAFPRMKLVFWSIKGWILPKHLSKKLAYFAVFLDLSYFWFQVRIKICWFLEDEFLATLVVTRPQGRFWAYRPCKGSNKSLEADRSDLLRSLCRNSNPSPTISQNPMADPRSFFQQKLEILKAKKGLGSPKPVLSSRRVTSHLGLNDYSDL